MVFSESKRELLVELFERSMDKVFNLSANYLMTIPKKGREKEFAHEKEIADMLADMLSDLIKNSAK